MPKTLFPCQTKGHWGAKEVVQVGKQKGCIQLALSLIYYILCSILYFQYTSI